MSAALPVWALDNMLGIGHCGRVDTRELVDAISVAENAYDWDRLGAMFSDQVTIVHPGVGPVVGRDANVAVIRFIVGAISGYHRTVENLVVEGDSGAFCFTITGTHTGDLPGYPATGNPVEIAGAMFFRVSGGEITHSTEMLNHDSTRNLSLR
jgi:predicted ester cyclase